MLVVLQTLHGTEGDTIEIRDIPTEKMEAVLNVEMRWEKLVDLNSAEENKIIVVSKLNTIL